MVIWSHFTLKYFLYRIKALGEKTSKGPHFRTEKNEMYWLENTNQPCKTELVNASLHTIVSTSNCNSTISAQAK